MSTGTSGDAVTTSHADVPSQAGPGPDGPDLGPDDLVVDGEIDPDAAAALAELPTEAAEPLIASPTRSERSAADRAKAREMFVRLAGLQPGDPAGPGCATIWSRRTCRSSSTWPAASATGGSRSTT